jgi:hypothetical protein
VLAQPLQQQVQIVQQQHGPPCDAGDGGLERGSRLLGPFRFARRLPLQLADLGIQVAGRRTIARRLERVGHRIQAIQPELRQPVDLDILLLRKRQRQELALTFRLAQFGGDAAQQRGLAHASLADDQMVLLRTVAVLGRDVRDQRRQQRSVGDERTFHLVVRQPQWVEDPPSRSSKSS